MKEHNENLNTQIFYCELCNKSIHVTCDYSNIKNVMVHSDVDIEFELMSRVKCPNCSCWTSTIIHPLLEDVIILLNKYKYTTIYSDIYGNHNYIYIKFKKGVRIPRKIRKHTPENWEIGKGYNGYYVMASTSSDSLNSTLEKLIELEKFILTYMNKERK